MKGINEWGLQSGTFAPNTELTAKINKYFERELAHIKEDQRYNKVAIEHQARIQIAREIILQMGSAPIQRTYREALQLMAKVYDRLGDDTDLWVAHRGWKGESALLGLIAENIEEEDKLILDAGCGTGIDINALASVFPDRSFIGYDCSPRQIELAAQRTKRLGNRNVRLFVANHRNIASFQNSSSVDIAYVKSGGWEDQLIPRVMHNKTDEEILYSRYKSMRAVLKSQSPLIIAGRIREEERDKIVLIPGFEFTGKADVSFPPEVYGIASYKKAS